jgi:branched-chain amino acid aminotransferase
MANFKPYPYAIIDGKVLPIAEANISIMTNALHYGGAVFGGIKAYETPKGVGIFRLADHIARMQVSCKILRFTYGFDATYTQEQIIALARKNKLTGKTYIRPLIFRADTELSPDINGTYDLSIYMLDMSNSSYIDSSKGLSVCVSSWQRNSDNALPPRTKASGGYINSALAIHDAHTSGYDSAILLNQHGDVGEGAVMNLFMVKNNVLLTPTVDADILEGITRKTVIELAKELNIPVQERTITRSELYTADEVFFCGTAVEITWCQSIDNVEISSTRGKITSQLVKAYHSLPNTHPHLFTIIK